MRTSTHECVPVRTLPIVNRLSSIVSTFTAFSYTIYYCDIKSIKVSLSVSALNLIAFQVVYLKHVYFLNNFYVGGAF